MIRLVVVLVLIGYPVFIGCDSFFYYPDRLSYDKPGEFNLAHEDVYFNTSDGVKLHGWFLPAYGQPSAAQRARDGAHGTVLHFHGNAANVSAHIGLVEWLVHAGYHVLMFDYRGYGRSAGRVHRAGTIRDGHAAVDYLLTRPEVDRRRLFAYGQSLGGAVAIVVAAERPELRAVVAESTFSSYQRIAALHGRRVCFGLPLGDAVAAISIERGYDPRDYVARIAPRPLLVISGGRDTICFPQLGQELYDAAAEPKHHWHIPEAAHLEIVLNHGKELQERMLRLFDEAAER